MTLSARVPCQLLLDGFAQGLCVATGCPHQHCGSPLAEEERWDVLQAICFVVTRSLPGDSGWELQITPALRDPISFHPPLLLLMLLLTFAAL